jgi:hypothetical protein
LVAADGAPIHAFPPPCRSPHNRGPLITARQTKPPTKPPKKPPKVDRRVREAAAGLRLAGAGAGALALLRAASEHRPALLDACAWVASGFLGLVFGCVLQLVWFGSGWLGLAWV